jgi:hypothetical protein
MAQTKEGAQKAKRTMYEKYGGEYYQTIGQKGGTAITENTKKKGYGSNRELARLSGAKGGLKSRKPRDLEA